MIVVKQKGNFNNLTRFLDNVRAAPIQKILEKYAKQGLDALMSATPIKTGATASAWGYEISKNDNGYAISWTNSNIVDGVPIALIIQYGHGTRNGGYVQGVDYINPALRPVFDKLASNVWKEVTTR